jgi:hypothetical protein
VSAPFVLSSIEDAIYMAELTLGDDQLAALVVDARMAMPVTGPVPPDGILQYDRVLLDAIGDDRDRLVLATRRRTGPPFVLEDELAWWRQLRHAHEGRALELADWLVFVRDECVLSLAEIAGPPAAWAA